MRYNMHIREVQPMTNNDIENWWAAQAMIASYNHVYQVAFGTTYTDLGTIGVSHYGKAKVGASFQIEFLALCNQPEAVVQAIRAYPTRPGEEYVLDVFHPSFDSGSLIDQYATLGFDYRSTRTILGRKLPVPARGQSVVTYKILTSEQVAQVNPKLAADGEMIYLQTVADPYIHNYAAEVDRQVAGWAQLVTVQPQVAYLHQLYTLVAYRRRGVAAALLDLVHAEAWKMGCQHVVLIPSTVAMALYARYAYRPLLYLSVFKPEKTGWL